MAALLFFLPFNNHENEQEWEGRVFSSGGGCGGALIPNKRIFFSEKRRFVQGSSLFDMITRGEVGDLKGPASQI